MQAKAYMSHMGGCQNYGPFLGTLNIRCRIIIGIQQRTIILRTPHMSHIINSLRVISGLLEGCTIEIIKGDTRSLDYRSYGLRKISSPGPTSPIPLILPYWGLSGLVLWVERLFVKRCALRV